MKKSIICMIVLIIMMLSLNIVSSAAYLGDINADGKITASDARSILRVSAKLDKIDDEKIVFADVNADDRITASDARTVLRMSAKLEQLQELTTKAPETELTTEIESSEMTTDENTTGLPDNEETSTEETSTEESSTEEPATEPEEVSYPEAVEAFISGSYYISGKTDDEQNIKIAVSGSDTEIAVMSGDAQLSVLKKAAQSFLKLISATGEKYYVSFTELMKEKFGADFTALTSYFDFSAFSDREAPVMNTIIENEVAYDVFGFENEGSVLNFYFTDGKIVKIENIPSDGEDVISFAVEEMSGMIPSDMLGTDGFTATGIEKIPYIIPEFADDSSSVKPSVKTYPVAVKVFLSGKYHMTGTLYDGEDHTFGYTYDGTDKKVTVDGVSYFRRRSLQYVHNNEFYAQVTDKQLNEYGIDFNSVLEDNTFEIDGKAECIAFEKSTFAELPCDNYTFRDKNGNMMKFTIVFERLARITVLDADGNEVKYVVVDEFDDDIPDGMLTLIGYRRADIETILG